MVGFSCVGLGPPIMNSNEIVDSKHGKVFRVLSTVFRSLGRILSHASQCVISIARSGAANTPSSSLMTGNLKVALDWQGAGMGLGTDNTVAPMLTALSLGIGVPNKVDILA